MILAGPDFRVPPNIGVVQLIFILLVIDTLSRSFGDYVLTSWYRDAATNARVGGVGNSLHQVGLGIDVVMMDDRNLLGVGVDSLRGLFGFQPSTNLFAAKLAAAWRSIGPEFQAVPEGDHLHLELDVR